MRRPIHLPEPKARAVTSVHRPKTGMLLWVTASLFTSSCLFHKEPRAFRPPPVVAKVPVEKPPPVLQPPPEIAAEIPPIEDPLLPNNPPQFSPPAPVRATAPPPRTPKQVAVQPVETPAVVEPPTPPPQLGQIFTPQQRQENSQILEGYLTQVKRAVATFATKNLNREDRETAELVKNFLLQAEQQRDKDLAAAVNLAKRADSLAKDLLDRVR